MTLDRNKMPCFREVCPAMCAIRSSAVGPFQPFCKCEFEHTNIPFFLISMGFFAINQILIHSNPLNGFGTMIFKRLKVFSRTLHFNGCRWIFFDFLSKLWLSFIMGCIVSIYCWGDHIAKTSRSSWQNFIKDCQFCHIWRSAIQGNISFQGCPQWALGATAPLFHWVVFGECLSLSSGTRSYLNLNLKPRPSLKFLGTLLFHGSLDLCATLTNSFSRWLGRFSFWWKSCTLTWFSMSLVKNAIFFCSVWFTFLVLNRINLGFNFPDFPKNIRSIFPNSFPDNYSSLKQPKTWINILIFK